MYQYAASSSGNEALSQAVKLVARRCPAATTNESWDGFAAASGAVWLAGREQNELARLRSLHRGRLDRWEVVAIGPAGLTKVAQCCFLVTACERRFLGPLQAPPSWKPLWREIMNVLLGALPAGRYVYGDHWSLEPNRATDFGAIAGVAVDDVEAFWVQAIRFEDYEDWTSYYRAVSANVWRNVRQLLNKFPEIAVRRDQNWTAMRTIASANRLRRAVHQRKRLGYDLNLQIVKDIVRYFLAPSGLETVVVSAEGRDLASGQFYTFGDTCCYYTGGSADGASGAGWLMITEAIRTHWARSPRGVFVLGHHDERPQPEVGAGIQRQRTSLRKRDYPGAVVKFQLTT